jgi:hypothetical protein
MVICSRRIDHRGYPSVTLWELKLEAGMCIYALLIDGKVVVTKQWY